MKKILKKILTKSPLDYFFYIKRKINGGGNLLIINYLKIKTTDKKHYWGWKEELTPESELYQQKAKKMVKELSYPSSHKYSVTICEEKKFMWFQVAKVASRTIYGMLKKSGIYLDADHPYRCHYAKNVYKDYFKFAFIRNPYDRLVSCYKNKVLRVNHFKFSDEVWEEMKQDFGKFVDFVGEKNIEKCSVHLRLQSKLIDLNEINFIGRMENFDDDIRYVFDKLEIPYKEIMRENVSEDKTSYRAFYNEELKEKVTKIYAKDLNIFGYDF